MPKLCIHCAKPKSIRTNGLCWGCYAQSDIRSMYFGNPRCRRGVGNGNDAKPAPAPTPIAPGERIVLQGKKVTVVNDKLAVLVARAERGEALFHVDDARFDLG